MRIALTFAVLALFVPSVSTAEAASRKRTQSSATSVERDRANNVDPTGVYKGYPDWARIAFSNGGRRTAK